MTDGATAIPEVQALLRALAAGRDVAELGAAFGGTAALHAETANSVVTVESDSERAAVAREPLRGIANVELLEGDAYDQLRVRGPFGLVFVDGGPSARLGGDPRAHRAGRSDRQGRPHARPSRRRGTTCASSCCATRDSRRPRSSRPRRWR